RADRERHRGRSESLRLRQGTNAGEWNREVFLHVVAERLERRDVDDAYLLAARSTRCSLYAAVDCPEDSGERFPRTGRGGDQRVAPGGDLSPSDLLRRGRR